MPCGMFEPLKLIAVGLAILLLAPLGFVFWRIAVFQPRPEPTRRAEIETTLRERAREMGTAQEDGSVIRGVTVVTVEAIGFSESTAPWLSFYPHRWAGIIGLVSVAATLACLLVSLFYIGGLGVGTSDWSSPSTPTSSPP
jgi:hypothetical protein